MNTLDATMTESRRSDANEIKITASSFILALLFAVTIFAAYSDRPVFWHLFATLPLAAAFGLLSLSKKRLGRRRSVSSRVAGVNLRRGRELAEERMQLVRAIWMNCEPDTVCCETSR
jgi:hypothetical protein